MSTHGQFRVGTSGWNYKHWRGPFYPEQLPVSQWFAHYARVFDTVEINNTFYHLPPPATFEKWDRQAPPNFCYAVKANRFITHMKKLKDADASVARFFDSAKHLGNHLGPVLYQLPPRWHLNLDRLREFCSALLPKIHHVIEFREKDWLVDATFEVLQEYGVSLCVHDLIQSHPVRITGPIVYLRFHGAGAKYAGDYLETDLKPRAEWFQQAAGAGHDCYAYFNNDAHALAIKNAREFREMLG